MTEHCSAPVTDPTGAREAPGTPTALVTLLETFCGQLEQSRRRWTLPLLWKQPQRRGRHLNSWRSRHLDSGHNFRPLSQSQPPVSPHVTSRQPNPEVPPPPWTPPLPVSSERCPEGIWVFNPAGIHFSFLFQPQNGAGPLAWRIRGLCSRIRALPGRHRAAVSGRRRRPRAPPRPRRRCRRSRELPARS